jgi:hypothetical protein
VTVGGHHADGGEELEDHDLGLHVGMVQTERHSLERALLLHHDAETVLLCVEREQLARASEIVSRVNESNPVAKTMRRTLLFITTLRQLMQPEMSSFSSSVRLERRERERE